MQLKSIYKYTLNPQETTILSLPKGIKILSTESQNDNIVVYGIVDPNEDETQDYEFRVYGTGFEFFRELEFLGTVKMYNGELMFHVFYKKV